MRWRQGIRGAVLAATVVYSAACASSSTRGPAATPVASYPFPEVPAAVRVTADVAARHRAAWDRLQQGDAARAATEFRAIFTASPQFYPARVGEGFALLARRRHVDAEAAFSEVSASHQAYLPAWLGRTEALLAMGRTDEAIPVLERVVVLAPARDTARTRLELLRFRVVQAAIDRARRASQARRFDDAATELTRAAAVAPGSGALWRDLASVEMARGRWPDAEAHARKAIATDASDAEAWVVLGDVLEGRQRFREAADAYGRAAAIDPRPAWTTRARELRERAEARLLPASFAALTSAPTVTRAEAAAFIAIHLVDLVNIAPRRSADVAVDVRTHWAVTWIVPVLRSGIMATRPDHRFEPDVALTRAELASVAGQLIPLGGSSRADITSWRAARPALPDVPASHAAYRAAAFALAAGAMAARDDGRFAPSGAASGADLDRLVRRLTVAPRR